MQLYFQQICPKWWNMVLAKFRESTLMLDRQTSRYPAYLPNITALALICVALIWGGTFIAGKSLSGTTPPLLSAFLRFFIASITLFAYMRWRRQPIHIFLSRSQKLRILTLGLFGIFSYNICFFYGLHYISASRASLIVAINPAMIALSAFLFMRERLNVTKIIGISSCLLGAATIILSKDPAAILTNPDTWKGDCLILGCVASWVTYSIVSRSLIRQIGAIRAVFYSLVAGTVMLFFAALLYGDLNIQNLSNLGGTQIISLLFLGVLGSALAYVLYYQGIARIGPTRSGVYIALVPLFAVVLAWIFFHESISGSMIAGGLGIFSGILLCNRF
jgi:drug/metabolite transporter (DMT)-like permease